MKSFSKVAAAGLVLGLMASLAVSAAQGSETKGKYYFKKTCKPCHVEGKSGGLLTPLSKTQAQWKAYFQAGKHNKGKEALSALLNEQQLLDVQTFLVAHASDSPQPETCGG